MNSEKPTIPEILPLLEDYLKDNPVGGCLHVVLDDGNIDSSTILLCLDIAIEHGDNRAIVIAEMLLKMSKTQRTKITRKHYGEIIRKVSAYW